MMVRDSRRVMGAILVVALGIIWSCTQPADVLDAVAQTELTVTIERLPQLPVGMTYELWASKSFVRDTTVATADLLPIARFTIVLNDSQKLVLDTAGNDLGSKLIMPADILGYKYLFVSVEKIADPDRARPANIMLGDNISGVLDETLRLNFPLADSLWMAIIRYNMESVSDNNRDLNDGSGIWFSSYRAFLDTLNDTFSISSITYVFDTIIPEIVGSETINIDSCTRAYLYDVTNVHPETVTVDYGPDSLLLNIDSFQHIGVRMTRVFQRDTVAPFIRRTPTWTWNTSGTRQLRMDIFSQDNFALPDYGPWGWVWKGWVVSPYIPKTAVGAMTKPAWTYKTASFNFIPGDTGGLLTTGTFYDITKLDQSNPFTYKIFRKIDTASGDTLWKIPNKPGEDWLNTTELQNQLGLNSVNLLPNNNGNEGTIFVTLEPLNYTTDSTNFPLIAFLGSVPAARNTITAATVGVTMFNKTGSVPGDLFGGGFPEIAITFRRL